MSFINTIMLYRSCCCWLPSLACKYLSQKTKDVMRMGGKRRHPKNRKHVSKGYKPFTELSVAPVFCRPTHPSLSLSPLSLPTPVPSPLRTTRYSPNNRRRSKNVLPKSSCLPPLRSLYLLDFYLTIDRSVLFVGNLLYLLLVLLFIHSMSLYKKFHMQKDFSSFPHSPFSLLSCVMCISKCIGWLSSILICFPLSC